MRLGKTKYTKNPYWCILTPTMNIGVKIVILAAGKGVRMKSVLPKVLARLAGKHMIKHLLEEVDKTGIADRPIIVVGYKKELVMGTLGKKYDYVTQKEQQGTGHALLSAKEACKDAETIIVLSGDQPFIKSETIQALLSKHLDSGAKITISTTTVPDFQDWRETLSKYGRIIRVGKKIIDREYADASAEEKQIKELNVSCYAFNAPWLWANIKKITKEKNTQKEFYITDLWQIASEEGEKIESVQMSPEEALGANSKEELEILEQIVVE